jgi:hypothetical protein
VLWRDEVISMDRLTEGDEIEVKVKDGLVVKVRLEGSESPDDDDEDDDEDEQEDD